MTQTVKSLTDEVLAKLGATSLTQVTATLPSALTTDANIHEADVELKAGRVVEAFHQLSLTHSTLLHHRTTQRLYKPKRHEEENSEGTVIPTPETLQGKKNILAAATKEETVNLLKKLPPDWTVVQITAQNEGEDLFRKVGSQIPTPGLYVSRCSCGPQPSVTVQAVSTPKDGEVRSIIQEMASIKEEIKSSFVGEKSQDHRPWCWSKREELNSRLKTLVKSMEVAWLRHWCCLLVGSLHPREEKTLDEVMSHIISSHDLTLTDSQKHSFKCIMSCPVDKCSIGDSDGELRVREGVAAVLGQNSKSKMVKDLCTTIKGAKDSLHPIRKTSRNPVILLLDKSTASLPWEMMWVLRNQPVTRMPSLRMLALLYEHHSNLASSVLVEGVNVNKGFYLLDPEGNLPRTRERLKPVLERTAWSGITARRPSHQEFSEALSTKDVFVYAGHGSGSQYLPGELVEGTWCRALVLLYGCSSVHLAVRGRSPDPWGVVLHYLIANCPCVVGMLWDVTDRETDLLTTEMVQALRGVPREASSPLANPTSDVALLVARSRSLSKHFLMAAALCVYGLPLHLIHGSGD